MYALVDCNNFFVSCERVFNPALRNRPVVVLSSNDGCIVARSNEVKALGVPMGAPYFQYKNMLKRFDVYICSSNFSLYGDMSRRVMRVLQEICSIDTIYSVDEAFIDVTGIISLQDHAEMIQKKVYGWVGIPVSIGIGPTRTLAKLTNDIAKKNPEYNGIYSIETRTNKEKIFSLPVQNVWGIGKNTTKKLQKYGIHTIAELVDMPSKRIRSEFGVSLERTALELRGVDCIDMSQTTSKKSIIRSRSFEKKVYKKEDILQAVASHIMSASEKLRKMNMGTQHITVYFRSRSYGSEKRHTATGSRTFMYPVQSPFTLIAEARKIIEREFQSSIAYAKAGIMFTEINSMESVQKSLFSDEKKEQQQRHPIFDTMDILQNKYGKNSIRLGATGFTDKVYTKKQWSSPNYTTEWESIVKVN